jgi:hypothetical protein
MTYGSLGFHPAAITFAKRRGPGAFTFVTRTDDVFLQLCQGRPEIAKILAHVFVRSVNSIVQCINVLCKGRILRSIRGKTGIKGTESLFDTINLFPK